MEKKFVKSTLLLITLLIKTLLSRKFCQKCQSKFQECSYSNPSRPEFICSNSSRLCHSSQGGVEVANLFLVDVITCGHVSVTEDEIHRFYSSQMS